jgi:hypothetical protein
MPRQTTEERNARKTLWRAQNKHKVAESRRKYRAAHPRKQANDNLLRRYGITIEDRDRMLASQGGCCAACGTPVNTSLKEWSVDHDHVTHRVRGILCHHCNVALGMVYDDIEILKFLIEYLEKHHGVD